jgi:4-hydroxy-tetrahydrodipicolinate reductase
MPVWLEPPNERLAWFDSLEALDHKPDLLIDFTLPEGTLVAAAWCRSQGVPLLSGVTGLDEGHFDALKAAAEVVPVLWGANLGLGVNVMADLAARAAAVLGGDTPVTILDIHHQWKKDAPSGTALMLGQHVERGGDGSRSTPVRYENIREGEVVGEHRITFQLEDETLTLTHVAQQRSVFAKGAIRAAEWLLEQRPGFYSTEDWIGRD